MVVRFSDCISQRRLKILLTESNLSQREFAEKTGVSASVLSEALSGHHIISQNNAAKIADSCNVSSDWLVGGICDREGSPIEGSERLIDLLCDMSADKIEAYLNDGHSEQKQSSEEYQLRLQIDSIQTQLDALKNRMQ